MSSIPENELGQGPELNNKTILIVDDDPEIIESVKIALQSEGYTVFYARDGNQGLALAERENPDLIILDMMMPVLNGRDAFYQLKKISPNVKVLLTSGYVNSQDVEDVLENGAAGFLQKPYRIQSLAEKIRSILK